MKDKQKVIGVGIGVLIIAWALLSPSSPVNLGGSSVVVSRYSSVTETQVEVTNTISQVLAADSSRRLISIQNQGNTPIWCLLDGTTDAVDSNVTSTATASRGFIIQASSTDSGLWTNIGYTGVINCTAETAVSSTIITSP